MASKAQLTPELAQIRSELENSLQKELANVKIPNAAFKTDDVIVGSKLFRATAPLHMRPTQPLRDRQLPPGKGEGKSNLLLTLRVFWNWLSTKPLSFRFALFGAVALILSITSSLIYLLIDILKWIFIIGASIWVFLRGRRLVLRNGQGLASLLRAVGFKETAIKLERSAHVFAAQEQIREAERRAEAAGRAQLFHIVAPRHHRDEVPNFEMKVLQTGGLPLMAMLAQSALDQLHESTKLQTATFERYSKPLAGLDSLKQYFGSGFKLADLEDVRIEMHLVKPHGLVDPEFQNDPEADVKVVIPVLGSEGHRNGCVTIFLGRYQPEVADTLEYPLFERRVLIQQIPTAAAASDAENLMVAETVEEIAVFPDATPASEATKSPAENVIDADFTEVKKN